MISVCIPNYNSFVYPLVLELSKQAAKAVVPVEIIILDDASDPHIQEKNLFVSEIPLTRYFTSPQNRGRIFTRNRLAQLAGYDWLLFLDDDSLIHAEDFLQQYIRHATDANRLVTGGRKYAAEPPVDCRLMLHWKYGTHRESRWHEKDKNNIAGFQSNNFLVHRTVFTALQFPESLVTYGHEDTWMGIQLEQQGRSLLHIDNPVLHNRLETAEIFLEKSRHALENLVLLNSITDEQSLRRHIKIYRTYKKWKEKKMLPAFQFLYAMQKKKVEKSLASCSPDLFLFDLYRLYYLAKIFR